MSSSTPIPFIDLVSQQEKIKPQIDLAFQKVLAHGQYILGPEVKQIEQQLAEFTGAQYVLGCASGTDALMLALLCHEIGPGDAVFVPSFTFVATAEAVALLGATPVFVDVDPAHYLIDPDSLQQAIDTANEQNLTPKGIIPVDLFGQPADYSEITKIAEKHELFVIADAAQSFGATRAGKRVGSMAQMTTTSFFPAKPLGCYGDGGAVFTNDETLDTLLRCLHVHGQGGHRYEHIQIGFNGRLDTLQAAVLIEKLKIFDEEIRLRQQVAERYNVHLQDIARTPQVAGDATSVWAQYTLEVENRETLRKALMEEGVPTAVYYPTPLHQQPAYKHYPVSKSGLPETERLAAVVMSLPMHPYLDTQTQDRIIQAIRKHS